MRRGGHTTKSGRSSGHATGMSRISTSRSMRSTGSFSRPPRMFDASCKTWRWRARRRSTRKTPSSFSTRSRSAPWRTRRTACYRFARRCRGKSPLLFAGNLVLPFNMRTDLSISQKILGLKKILYEAILFSCNKTRNNLGGASGRRKNEGGRTSLCAI